MRRSACALGTCLPHGRSVASCALSCTPRPGTRGLSTSATCDLRCSCRSHGELTFRRFGVAFSSTRCHLWCVPPYTSSLLRCLPMPLPIYTSRVIHGVRYCDCTCSAGAHWGISAPLKSNRCSTASSSPCQLLCSRDTVIHACNGGPARCGRCCSEWVRGFFPISRGP